MAIYRCYTCEKLYVLCEDSGDVTERSIMDCFLHNSEILRQCSDCKNGESNLHILKKPILQTNHIKW